MGFESHNSRLGVLDHNFKLTMSYHNGQLLVAQNCACADKGEAAASSFQLQVQFQVCPFASVSVTVEPDLESFLSS